MALYKLTLGNKFILRLADGRDTPVTRPLKIVNRTHGITIIPITEPRTITVRERIEQPDGSHIIEEKQIQVVDNQDYLEYLAWLDQGNTPDPADPATTRTQDDLIDEELNNEVRMAIYFALALDGPFADKRELKQAVKARLP